MPALPSRRLQTWLVSCAILVLGFGGAAAAPAGSENETAPMCLIAAEETPTPAVMSVHEAFIAPLPSATVPSWGPIKILGEEVPPGQMRELFLEASQSFAGAAVAMSVAVIRGHKAGPTLCLTAGIHGDELNGIEIVRQAVDEIRPEALYGTVLAVPIVNINGFQRSSRYLPDRRDLNRYFPGHPVGSSASRIAHSLFERVIDRCHALVDFHSGSFHRTNLPQVRGDLFNPKVLELTKGFGAEFAVYNPGREGTLRRAATDAGIAAIVYEAGEPMRFQKVEIERGLRGVRRLMVALDMVDAPEPPEVQQRLYYETHWVRVDIGGILITEVEVGAKVGEGDALGMITDPIRKQRSVVTSPYSGRVIGMTLAPVVMPGYAAFHLGVETTPASKEDAERVDEEEQRAVEPPEMEPIEGEEEEDRPE